MSENFIFGIIIFYCAGSCSECIRYPFVFLSLIFEKSHYKKKNIFLYQSSLLIARDSPTRRKKVRSIDTHAGIPWKNIQIPWSCCGFRGCNSTRPWFRGSTQKKNFLFMDKFSWNLVLICKVGWWNYFVHVIFSI